MTIRNKEIEEREKFLGVYKEFYRWLESLAFREGDFWNESSTPSDYMYSKYLNKINPLYGIDHYILDILNLSIRFILDRDEHKIMFVGSIGAHSSLYDIEEAKGLILDEVKRLRGIQLYKLNGLKDPIEKKQ